MKKNDFSEKHEIGCEINGVVYGVEINEKNNLELMHFV
jgi:hypothetical protein